ncbi:MAG: hypothetical protein ACJ8AK_15335 [Gemmatimonadaceae bacterium]
MTRICSGIGLPFFVLALASTGVRDVVANGVQVLRNGEHTGALSGRVVRGPASAARKNA